MSVVIIAVEPEKVEMAVKHFNCAKVRSIRQKSPMRMEHVKLNRFMATCTKCGAVVEVTVQLLAEAIIK
jgi:transcription elongation factor Elf1